MPRSNVASKAAAGADQEQGNLQAPSARPRPRAVGLGACGALLRAAGALPRRVPGQGPAQCSGLDRGGQLQKKPAGRMDPHKQPSSPDKKSGAATAKHVDFLEHCLGGPAALLEAEIEREVEAEKTTPSVERQDAADVSETSSAQTGEQFCLHSSLNDLDVSDAGDDTSDECQDLEDMFDFDPEKLAGLMQTGASVDDLTEHLQGEYALALEQRLVEQHSSVRLKCQKVRARHVELKWVNCRHS